MTKRSSDPHSPLNPKYIYISVINTLVPFHNVTPKFPNLQVLYAHVPREPDELELVIGDFIFVTQEEMSKTTDGWVVGISWLTGSTGYLPTNYVERTAETNAWTLHTSLPLIPGAGVAVDDIDGGVLGVDVGVGSSDRLVVAQECDSRTADSELENLYAKVCKPGRESPAGICDSAAETSRTSESGGQDVVSSTTPTLSNAPRQLFIARHGERVDFTFGSWIPYSFSADAVYQRKDLNMPASVPRRKRGPEGFNRDCPLTSIGNVQARMVGEAMCSSGVEIHHVFCSPSLRCVQTCHNILTGLGVADRLKIHLEPGLFEWLAWYQDSMPDWMDEDELEEAGYNIDKNYKPYISAEELQDTQESCQQFYIRNFFVTQCALQVNMPYIFSGIYIMKNTMVEGGGGGGVNFFWQKGALFSA